MHYSFEQLQLPLLSYRLVPRPDPRGGEQRGLQLILISNPLPPVLCLSSPERIARRTRVNLLHQPQSMSHHDGVLAGH